MLCDRCKKSDNCKGKAFTKPLFKADCNHYEYLGDLATNRMIVMFCSKGLGEWTHDTFQCTGNQWSYHVGDEDEPVSESLRVRT